MKNILYIVFSLIGYQAWSQSSQGEVSYLSAGNVYVRFASTAKLSTGDTLFLDSDHQQACLRILKKSSLSALCERIADCELEKGRKVYAPNRVNTMTEKTDPKPTASPDPPRSRRDSLARRLETESQFSKPIRADQHFRARFSYDNASTYRSDDLRGNMRNVFRSSLSWDSLGGRDLRFESYFNAQHFQRSYESEADPFRLNFYNLALVYGIEQHLIVLGRRINRRFSSLGAIDGLQYEYQLKKFRFGAIAGSRPDFENFGYNPGLMQYGAYLAYDHRQGKFNLQTTLGAVQQSNNGAIDRRYLYTQNSLSYGAWFWFSSAEVDLYQNYDTATAQSDFKLTSLYLSLRYRVNSKWSLFASYDTRRQIIFFEQFDSEVERLLTEQGQRQGLRLRTNYRLFANTQIGLTYNIRLASNANEGSENYSAYLSQRLPWRLGTLSYRFNLNRSNFLSSEINSLRYSRYWGPSNRLYTAAYYRYLSYLYPQREIVLDPVMYMGLECSYRFAGDWSLGALAEYNINYQEDLIRFNLRLTKNIKF